MSEDDHGNGKATIADETKSVAVEVYRDGVKGAVQEAGHLVGGVAKLVFWPIRKIVDGANNALERFSKRVEEKLKSVPPERLLTAPATIAGPAALQYAMLGDGDEVAGLREMFETLLAHSMDQVTAEIVHPAFVGMLSQMTPDEARILRSIEYRVYAAYDVNRPEGDGLIPYGLRTLLGRELGIDNQRLQSYLTNLNRLGIVRIEDGRNDGSYYGYVLLAAALMDELPHSEPEPSVEEGGSWIAGVGDMLAEAERRFDAFVLSPKALVVTAFGQLFLQACVGVSFLSQPAGPDAPSP